MRPQEYLIKCLKALLKDEEKYIGLKFALKQGGKYGFLSPQKLGCFAGNPTELREYIESFLDQCLFKSYIYGQYWNVALIKHSRDSDTKRSMHATGCSVIFYATAFKTLKREFRDRFLISYLKLKNLFCQLQIKDNNRTSL